MTPELRSVITAMAEKFRAAGPDRLIDTIVELTRDGCDNRCFAAAILGAFPHPALMDEIGPALKEASRRLVEEGQVALARSLYDPVSDSDPKATCDRASDPVRATYDRAWDAFLSAGFRALKNWVKNGSDPEKFTDLERIRFRWHPRQGATVQTATGRINMFRLQRARSASTRGAQVGVARRRQPHRRRQCRPASVAGDRDAAEPEPPRRKTPPGDEAGGIIPRDDDAQLRRPERRATLIRRHARPLEDGASWLR